MLRLIRLLPVRLPLPGNIFRKRKKLFNKTEITAKSFQGNEVKAKQNEMKKKLIKILGVSKHS